MWPFSESDSKQAEFACDGQMQHEYETLEEREVRYVSRHYDPTVDGEVVIVATIPIVAECEVCGDRIENDIKPWIKGVNFKLYKGYDIEFTKVIINDFSDAERIDVTDELD